MQKSKGNILEKFDFIFRFEKEVKFFMEFCTDGFESKIGAIECTNQIHT